MRLRRITTTVAVAALAVAGIAASPEPGELTEEGYLVVGDDPEGDWGENQGDTSASPLAAQAGQDLVGAAIGPDPEDEAVLHFVISVSSLPSAGGMPEFTRYTWNFDVDGEFAELDGKFTNYSRGTCDPTAGTCPPPRDPGPAPFSLRGNCTVNEANVTTCQELGKVQAIFDASAGTITVPVPLEMINAVSCTRITPGENLFGGSISAAPSAYFTSSLMPLDTMFVTKTYVVPSADGAECVKA